MTSPSVVALTPAPAQGESPRRPKDRGAAQADPTCDGDSSQQTWTIAEIADEFDVTHRTVRHYEELGLISPQRRGTMRLYHRRDRTRLALILRGKRVGFPLEQIRTIIDMYDAPAGEAGQLVYLMGQISERRAEVERRRADLEAILAELDLLTQRCANDLHGLPSTSRG